MRTLIAFTLAASLVGTTGCKRIANALVLQDSKTFLITANELRRRVRDKTGNISPEKLRWDYVALVWHSDHFHEKLR